MISVNCDNLLSSTKLSQVISRIQRNGFEGHVVRSTAAPPKYKQILCYDTMTKITFYVIIYTDDDLTFNENLKLIVLDPFLLHINLESQQ